MLQDEDIRIIIVGGSLACFFFVLFSLSLLFTFQRSLRKKQVQSFKNMLDAIEKERQRIGQDLHDDLGPMLSGIKLSLNIYEQVSLKDNMLLETLNEQKKMLSQTISVLRSTAYELNPHVLISSGLLDSISDRCLQYSGKDGWELEFTGNYYPSDANSFNSLSIYRIINELITNSIKHSKGNRIIISFDKLDDKLKISYQDNGVGVNLEHKMGLGMSGITTRIALLDGSIKIKSGPNKGYQVSMLFKPERLRN